MSTFRIDFEHADLVVMYRVLDKVGAAPQKALNKATSKAAAITKRAVKAEAPVAKKGEHKGTLKRNIATKTERSRMKGKKVRETTFRGGDEANALLQKPIKNPGVLGGSSPKAYYPASQEYGFLARAPGGGVQYIEGKHYMLRGAESASAPAKEAMIETMKKELDKIWQSTTG